MSNKKLINRILEASKKLAQNSVYGNGNYIVASSDFYHLLEIEKIRNKRIQSIKDILK